jgi:membrane protein
VGGPGLPPLALFLPYQSRLPCSGAGVSSCLCPRGTKRALKLHDWRKLIKDTVSNWNDHGASTQSAALAFYTIFSLAPLLLVVIALAGRVFGADAVRGRIFDEFRGWMGPQGAAFIQVILQSAAKKATSKLAAALGTATLIFGASGVFIQLQEALNAVWGVTPRPGAVITTLLRKRLLSFAVVLGIGFLLMVSLLVSTALTALGDYLETHFSLSAKLLQGANLLVSFCIVALLFALIYRLLPDVKLAWRDVFLGAAFTSVLFGVGKTVIGFYLGRTGAASAYGAAGSLVMILSWVYYSALVFLLGAEFTRVYCEEFHGVVPAAANGAAEVDTIKPEAKADPAAPSAACTAGAARPAAARTEPARRRQA